ncbi:MAG: hypothetical protein M3N11_07585 [Actinomycetota bacterium]|nr:hypothetical protein [Actinomycetota bacterium]
MLRRAHHGLGEEPTEVAERVRLVEGLGEAAPEADALEALDSDRDVGNLGVVTRGDTLAALRALLRESGAPLVAWYGVRVLTDHLTGVSPPGDLALVLEAEWRVNGRDPYRCVSRLLHVIGQRMDE